MRLNIVKLAVALAAVVFGANYVSAATTAICPGVDATNNFSHAPDSTGTGCNVVITIAANGGISTAVVDVAPYDGSEDTLVGVINNSSTPVTTLNITGSDIFGFDGDGICTFSFSGTFSNSFCSASQLNGTDPQDYQGPTSTFSITNANSGSVNFAGGIAGGGGHSYFSLEEPPTANLVVTTGSTPEPGTIVMFGTGLIGLAGAIRRKFRV